MVRSLLALLVGVAGMSRASGDQVLASLSTATTWINSQPIGPQALRGKVAVIDFWTYTCINWRRTMPYLRAWSEKYRAHGMVLIGVHSPEFVFERNLDNVRQGVRDTGVTFPVAVDNDFTIWRSFGNQYWPALYVFDARGRLRHQHNGEEGYEKIERVIRQLLVEAGQEDLGLPTARLEGVGAEAPANWQDLRTPETYLGHRRTRGFASPEGILPGEPRRYTLPFEVPSNDWGLSGTWVFEADRAVTTAAGGKIVFRFQARDLHLVMAPETRGKVIRFRVKIDGKPPGTTYGLDVDQAGRGTLKDQRMYQLIRQPAPIGERLFEIEFLDPGAGVFAFTFG